MDFKSINKDLTRVNSSITELLITLLITISILLLIQFHWNRRKMYVLASKINGPLALPVIGSGYKFVGTPEEMLNMLNKICLTYEFPIKFWLGHHLMFGIADPEHVQIILNHQKSLDKDELSLLFMPVMGDGLFLAAGNKWKTSRKLYSQAFSQRILNNYVTTFSQKATNFANDLEQYVGKGIFDIHDMVGKHILDVILGTTMGVEFKSDINHKKILHSLDDLLNILMQRLFKVWYHSDFIFYKSALGKKFNAILNVFVDFTNKVLMEKKALCQRKKELNQYEVQTEENLTNTKCLLELLIEMSDNDLYDSKQIREEVATFIIGGADTTTTTTGNVFVMMGMHPELQEKIYEEVIEVIGKTGPIEYTDLANLKYTERFMMETLRLFPITSYVFRKHKEDVNLGKVTLPAGSISTLMVFYMQRLEKYWPDPLRFDPDRFLPEEVAKRNPYSHIPFAGGPRNCIGKKFAIMMVKCFIAHTVRKYRISTSYERIEDIRLQQNLTTKLIDGVLVKLERRE